MVFGQHKNYDITKVSYIYIIVNKWGIQAKYEMAFDLLSFLSLLVEQFHSVVNETRKWDY